MPRARILLAAATGALLVPLGCIFSLPAVTGGEYACQQDQDCAEGYSCDSQEKLCRPGRSVRDDAGAPDAGAEDAGLHDVSPPLPDGGGGGDGGLVDGGLVDGGLVDGGDAGPFDGGPADGGDAGVVDGGNRNPIAVDDAVVVPEDDVVSFDPRENDSDPDGDSLTVVSVGAPSLGEARITPDGALEYRPARDAFGTDGFSYTIADGNGGEATARIDVVIEPVADAPRAEGMRLFTTPGRDLSGTLKASDADGDALTFEVTVAPDTGSVDVDPATGAFTYTTPPSIAVLTDSFAFRVSDGQSASQDAVVEIRFADSLWTGASSEDWNDPTNWSPMGPPGSNDDALIPGEAIRVPRVAAPVEVGGLFVDAGTGVRIAEGATITAHGDVHGPPFGALGGFPDPGVLVLAATVGEASGRLGPTTVRGYITLEGDTRIGGDLLIENGGRLALGGHLLRVIGNTEVHLTSSGQGLALTDAGDRAVLQGDLVLCGDSGSGSSQLSFTERELFLQGDLEQRAPSGDLALIATGTRFVFNGSARQQVAFESPGLLASRLADVDVRNPAGVELLTPLFVTGRLVMREGAWLLGDEVHCSTSLPETNEGYEPEATVVEGVFHLSRSRILHGDLVVPPTRALHLDSHWLEVRGDVHVAVSGTSDGLFLDDDLDALRVRGDLTLDATASGANTAGHFSKGALRLMGDLVKNDTGGDRGLVVTGTRVVFEGAELQRVEFATSTADRSHLHDVVLADGAAVEVVGSLVITGQLSMSGGAQLSGGEVRYTGSLPQTTTGHRPALAVLDGDFQLSEPRVLHGDVVRVPSGAKLSLKGYSLEVLADLEVVAGSNNDGLFMTQQTDELIVDGDLIFDGVAGGTNTTGHFTDGRIVHRGGLFHQRDSGGARSFVCGGTTVVFAGPGQQTVRFDSPSPDLDRLCDVEVENGFPVNFATPAYISGRLTLADGATVRGQLLYFTSELPLTTSGYEVAASFLSGAFALEAPATLHGDWFIPANHSLSVGPHRLEVLGDLTVSVDGSDDGLFLQDPAGEVVVHGTALFDSLAGGGNTEGHLSAGTLRVGGHFIQAANGGTKSFISTGTRVVLDGPGSELTQVLTLSSMALDASRFSDLEVASGAHALISTTAYVTGSLRLGGRLEVVTGQSVHVTGDLILEAGGALSNSGTVTYGGSFVGDPGLVEGNPPVQN